MAVLTALSQVRSSHLPASLRAPLWHLFGSLLPTAMRLGLLSRPLPTRWARTHDPDHTTFLFGIGIDDASGRLSLTRGRLSLDWDWAAQNAALAAEMTTAMQSIADRYHGTFAPLFSWLLFQRITTVHSLGGCHLSLTPEQGVVSPLGEVHGYPGLYVSDGSVVPTAIGYHPVMTICALAERIAEHLAQTG